MARSKGLSEIANIARVSVSTVSRVLGGRGSTGPEVEARVRAAAAELGIDVLRTRKRRTVALVFCNLERLTEFQARILFGAEAYLAQHDWDLQVVVHRYDLTGAAADLQLPRVVTRAEPVSGIILGNLVSAGMVQALQSRRMPFAVLGNNVLGQWNPEFHDVVFTDDSGGSRALTAHLIEQGHRDIWCLANFQLPWYIRCGAGYRRAMEEAGLEPRVIDLRSQHQELGYLATKSLLSDGNRVTAIFAGNDQAACGAYRAAYELGRRIPEDVSIVGFNDSLGGILHPGLTSVREFPEHLGQHLAEFVLRRIQDQSLPPQQLTVTTQLVRRESVRPLPAGTSSR